MGNLYSQEEREEALKLGMKSGQLQRRGDWGSMWTRYMAEEAAGPMWTADTAATERRLWST